MFRASLHRLREWGVRVLFDESAPREARMPPWEEILEEVNRAHEAAGCHHEGVREQAPRRGPRKQRRDRARGLHVGRRTHRHLPPPAWPVPTRPGQPDRSVRSLAEPGRARHPPRRPTLGHHQARSGPQGHGRGPDRTAVVARTHGGAEYRAIPALRAALTDYEVIPAAFGIAMRDGPVRELPSLRRNVDQANRLYQAAHYATRRR